MIRYHYFLVLLLILGCSPAATDGVVAEPLNPEQLRTSPPAKVERTAKNIILLIGDGMGLTQITAAFYRNDRKLQMQRLPRTGLIKTHAADNLVTDSAAGATAFSIGEKANYQDVGINSEGKSMETILEEAHRRGKATGLVVSSTIIHATPASFFAHNPYRYNYNDIALELPESGVDFFVGGGKKFFDRREDELDLISELKANGYEIADYFHQDLDEVIIPRNKKFGYFTADDDPIPMLNGRDYMPLATDMALSFLSEKSEQGFFLMIEGSQIDWGGHSNNAEYIISEMLEFDQIIGQVLNFAEENGETLVIVTSDHETGGFTITPESKMDSLAFSFNTGKHTGTMVPVFAYGPGSELFSGVYENFMIYHKMRTALGFDRVSN